MARCCACPLRRSRCSPSCRYPSTLPSRLCSTPGAPPTRCGSAAPAAADRSRPSLLGRPSRSCRPASGTDDAPVVLTSPAQCGRGGAACRRRPVVAPSWWTGWWSRRSRSTSRAGNRPTPSGCCTPPGPPGTRSGSSSASGRWPPGRVAYADGPRPHLGIGLRVRRVLPPRRRDLAARRGARYRSGDDPMPSRFSVAAWHALEGLGVTHVNVVPAMLQMLLDAEALRAGGALRTLLYGASRIEPELARRTLAALPEVELIQGYGQTEGGPHTLLIGRRPPPRGGRSGPGPPAAVLRPASPRGPAADRRTARTGSGAVEVTSPYLFAARPRRLARERRPGPAGRRRLPLPGRPHGRRLRPRR